MPVIRLTTSQHAALLREAATCADPELRASLSHWYVHAVVEPDPQQPAGDDSAWREAVENLADPFGVGFKTVTKPDFDPLSGLWPRAPGPDTDPIDLVAELTRRGANVCSRLFDYFMREREEWLRQHPETATALGSPEAWR